jgi:outer membrane protein OmpA-like peptidoglycan-associated protein
MLVFFSVHAHQAPNQVNNIERKSFVVIAAFNFKYNAKRYTEYIRDKDMNANYAYNKQRQLYYVYSLISKEDEKAKELVWKLREDSDFDDAWVFRGELKGDQETPELIRIDLPKTNSTIQTQVKSNENISESSKDGIKSDKKNISSGTRSGSDSTIKETINSDQSTTTSLKPVSIVTKRKTAIKEEEPIIKEQYKLYINTVNAQKFKEVRGSIEIRDHQRDKKLKTVTSHKLVGINDPKNGSHSIKIVSRIFGFRPIEHVINLDNPVNDSTSNYVETIGDSIVVHFDLERLQMGEIAVMWNVYFFKDAAIMRPESKSEVNSLLAMLKENDKLKIKIHGHTNGSSHGKLLHLNLNDKDFFSISGNHMEDTGSAKKLSEYRGYTIQHYLMDQGIDESRMQVVGWGGKKMMFDKHDTQARKNVRVEVEILEI